MPRLIDLSYPLANGQASFPGDPPLCITEHCKTASAGCNVSEIRLSTHQGTHLDAPFHYFDDGMTIDQIPLDRFFGPAALIDLAPGSFLPADAPITLDLLQPHKSEFRPGAKIVYRTGWDRMGGEPGFFEHHPFLTPETALWIAEQGIDLLGMDTPSPGRSDSEVHLILLAKGRTIVLLETLRQLHLLPEHFTLAAFPLNIEGRDGSPARAVAITP